MPASEVLAVQWWLWLFGPNSMVSRQRPDERPLSITTRDACRSSGAIRIRKSDATEMRDALFISGWSRSAGGPDGR
jgi:hypothetical protein